MKKIVVIYQSKYGTTKKYAQWISEELSCDLLERKTIKLDTLKKYDVVIYGGGLYAGGVSGINMITKFYDNIKDKKIVIFTCGLADPNDVDNTNNIEGNLNKILTSEMQQSIKVFHLRGGIDYSKLGVIHKIMMAMLHKVISKKDYELLREEDKQMLDTYGKMVDFTNKDTIKPIITYISGL